MGLMLNFFRAYPWQTSLMLVALILSGMAEGIGLSAMLPLLNIALGEEAANLIPGGSSGSTTGFEASVLEFLQSMNIAPTLGNMLLIVVGEYFLRAYFCFWPNDR